MMIVDYQLLTFNHLLSVGTKEKLYILDLVISSPVVTIVTMMTM